MGQTLSAPLFGLSWYSPRITNPERTPAMKTKSVLVASLMTLAIAMPAWSDTLLLRNGRTLSRTLIAAIRNTISFQDPTGRRVRYSVSDVEAVQFGDGPYNSGNYGRPENGGRVNPVYDRNQDNRNDNRYQETAITDNRAWSGSFFP
jgi:hypothetical protein